MTLKFITINAWHGGRLMDTMLEFLKQEQPDILVLQEAYNDPRTELEPRFRTVKTLQAALKLPYASFAPCYMHMMPKLESEQGNAVLSKYPLTPKAVTFFSEPYHPHWEDKPETIPENPRNLQHVEIETPAGILNVFNFQGAWDLDGDSYNRRRQEMTDVIVKAIAGLPRVILAGDTNAKPTNEAIRHIEKHLTSVFKIGELKTTFNMRRKTNPGYATAVVDMIFVSPDIKVAEHHCPDIDASDHLPLVATLSLPNA